MERKWKMNACNQINSQIQEHQFRGKIEDFHVLEYPRVASNLCGTKIEL
jgi:hypothetical protein